MIVCCSDIRLKTPYSATREPDTVHYTYLDTLGRPVITLRKDNLVEQHILDFEVTAHCYVSHVYYTCVTLLQLAAAIYRLLSVLHIILVIRKQLVLHYLWDSKSPTSEAALVQPNVHPWHNRKCSLGITRSS